MPINDELTFATKHDYYHMNVGCNNVAYMLARVDVNSSPSSSFVRSSFSVCKEEAIFWSLDFPFWLSSTINDIHS